MLKNFGSGYISHCFSWAGSIEHIASVGGEAGCWSFALGFEHVPYRFS